MVPEANAGLVTGTLSSERDDRPLVTAETAIVLASGDARQS
jgi:hypothetical protein